MNKMAIVDEKIRKAIKAGIICGIPPAIAFILFLLISYIYQDFNLLAKSMLILSMLISGLAIFGSVILTIRYTRPFLHNIKDVVLVSSISGAFTGITFTVIIFIPIMLWVLRLIQYSDLGIDLYRETIVFFIISSCVITVGLINAACAATIGAIYVIRKNCEDRTTGL